MTDEKGDKKTIYPDFTIILGKECIMYWEHKGMYGDEKYFEHDQRKMQNHFLRNREDFAENGFFIDLIDAKPFISPHKCL